MLKLTTLTVTILAATTLTAVAHESRKTIDDTRAYQDRQIEQGRYSGDLTRREYRTLKEEQAHIAEIERRALADGHLSKREARDIRAAQKEAAEHIKAERHDGQVSWYRRWLYLHR